MLINSTWTLSVSEPTILPRSYNLELVKILHNQIGLQIGSEKFLPHHSLAYAVIFSQNRILSLLNPKNFITYLYLD